MAEDRSDLDDATDDQGAQAVAERARLADQHARLGDRVGVLRQRGVLPGDAVGREGATGRASRRRRLAPQSLGRSVLQPELELGQPQLDVRPLCRRARRGRERSTNAAMPGVSSRAASPGLCARS